MLWCNLSHSCNDCTIGCIPLQGNKPKTSLWELQHTVRSFITYNIPSHPISCHAYSQTTYWVVRMKWVVSMKSTAWTLGRLYINLMLKWPAYAPTLHNTKSDITVRTAQDTDLTITIAYFLTSSWRVHILWRHHNECTYPDVTIITAHSLMLSWCLYNLDITMTTAPALTLTSPEQSMILPWRLHRNWRYHVTTEHTQNFATTAAHILTFSWPAQSLRLSWRLYIPLCCYKDCTNSDVTMATPQNIGLHNRETLTVGAMCYITDTTCKPRNTKCIFAHL